MESRKEITIKAKLECLEQAINFVNGLLQEKGVSVDVRQRIELALEEMLVNISSYAYPEGIGEAKVGISFPKKDIVKLELWDRGTPYDPTKKPDPDLGIPLRERKIGGLGIYMTKIVMDEMNYEYADGYNHVTMLKDLKQVKTE